MKIDTDSEEMRWILIKFLKESLDFLSSGSSLGVRRGLWIKSWMIMNLGDEQLAAWFFQISKGSIDVSDRNV